MQRPACSLIDSITHKVTTKWRQEALLKCRYLISSDYLARSLELQCIILSVVSMYIYHALAGTSCGGDPGGVATAAIAAVAAAESSSLSYMPPVDGKKV